jgi:hypothetical protein
MVVNAPSNTSERAPTRVSTVRHRDRAHDWRWPTHRSRWRFSQRATGLPRNLRFADAVEIEGDDASGVQRVSRRWQSSAWASRRLSDCVRRPLTDVSTHTGRSTTRSESAVRACFRMGGTGFDDRGARVNAGSDLSGSFTGPLQPSRTKIRQIVVFKRFSTIEMRLLHPLLNLSFVPKTLRSGT